MNVRALTVAMLTLTGGFAVAQGATPQVGEPFPPFSEPNFPSGEPVSLRALRGKVVLIDFWATWCGHCVRETPHVRKAYEKHRDDGFEVIGVSLDSDKEKLAAHIEKERLTWRHICDGLRWNGTLVQRSGVSGIPAIFVLDRDGVVVGAGLRGEAIARAVKAALDKPWEGAEAETAARAALAAADALRDGGDVGAAYAAYERIVAEHARTGAAEIAAEKLRVLQRDPAVRRAILAASRAAECGRWLKFARQLAAAQHVEMARKYYQRVVKRCGDTEFARQARDELATLP